MEEDEVEDTWQETLFSKNMITYVSSSQLTLQYISHMGGVGEDLQEVLRRGFAGLHPRHDAARNQAGWGWVQAQTAFVGRRGKYCRKYRIEE